MFKVKWVLLMYGVLRIVLCLQVILERPILLYYNENYIAWANVSWKRFGRRSPYYMNLEGSLREHRPWDNNVTVHIEFFEFLHNEYRRSFVEVHYRMCDFLKKSRYIGRAIADHGLTCPILPGTIQLKNVTFPTEGFPNMFPFEKGRVYITITLGDNGEVLAKGQIDALFKNEPPKKIGNERGNKTPKLYP